MERGIGLSIVPPPLLPHIGPFSTQFQDRPSSGLSNTGLGRDERLKARALRARIMWFSPAAFRYGIATRGVPPRVGSERQATALPEQVLEAAEAVERDE